MIESHPYYSIGVIDYTISGGGQEPAMSRTIYRNSEIIISDEPTAALAPKANMSSIACLISYFVVKPVYIFHIVWHVRS